MSVIKPQEINLDFTQNSYKDIVVKQNDVNSRSVIVTCTNNGAKCALDHITQTCNIRMETPDGRPIYNPTTILPDGRVQIDFTEQMVLVGGKVDAELQVVDSTSQEIIHTMNLHIIIVSNVYSNDAIIASPEFDALNKALLAVQDCSELVETVHEIEANEKQREENEAQRTQEFEEMKNAVSNVDEHYNTVASTDVLGHVKVDNESIVIDENGVIRSGFGKVPDGVAYIDFDDSESVDYSPIDQVNGVKIYHTDDDKLIASWDNNGETKEIDLSGGSSSGESGFNDIYAEKSINLGRKADTEIGEYSATIGTDNTVIGTDSMAFGKYNKVNNQAAVAFGVNNEITHSTGYTYDDYGGSLAVGKENKIYDNEYNIALGYNNTINVKSNSSGYSTSSSFAVGSNNKVSGHTNIAMGYDNQTSYDYAVAIGRNNKSTGSTSIAMGYYCEATNSYSFAEGTNTKSTAYASHSEGSYTKATGSSSHAEGDSTTASGSYSHAEGYRAQASGYGSHAEGYSTTASASQSHAEGGNTVSNGYNSHAEGGYTTTNGSESHAEGYYTIATGNQQHVQGKYNIEDTENKYAHIVGGGDYNERKNIHTLDWEGNAVFAGNVADGNGATINGIETSTDGTVLSSSGGNIILNGIYGEYEQDTTEGYAIFNFYDKTTTSGGVTANIVDGVCTMTGQNPPNHFYVNYGNLNLSKLIDGQYIFARNNTIMLVYDATGKSIYSGGATNVKYDSATMKRIEINIYVPKASYKEGMSFIPMISNKDWSPIELYTGGFPAPNPSYPKNMTFPTFNVLNLENESGNKTISFDDEITLYRAYNAHDTITSSKITRQLKKIVLTGNEEIGGNAEEGYFLYSPPSEAKVISTNILSDHYKNNGTMDKVDYNIFIDENKNIRIQHSGFASIDEYKTWLSNNNVEIIYELATAEATELSTTVSDNLKNIKIYAGETTVSTDSTTIQPIIEVEYPTSKVGKYVVELRNGSGGSGGGGGTGYVPTNVSEFENDAGYITSDEADTQIQLAITQRTYTKNEIDTLLSELFISVEELPENPLPNKVYLIQGKAEVN